MTTTLESRLRRPRLGFVAQAVEAQNAESIRAKHSHLEFLEALTDGELASRENKGLMKRVKAARFPVAKTLEEFDFDFQPKLDVKLIKSLDPRLRRSRNPRRKGRSQTSVAPPRLRQSLSLNGYPPVTLRAGGIGRGRMTAGPGTVSSPEPPASKAVTFGRKRGYHPGSGRSGCCCIPPQALRRQTESWGREALVFFENRTSAALGGGIVGRDGIASVSPHVPTLARAESGTEGPLMISVRPAQASAMENALGLLDRFLLEIGEPRLETPLREAIRGAVRDAQIVFLVAYDDARAVGLCSLTTGFTTHGATRFALLDDCYVLESHRGASVLSSLVIEAQACALTMGCGSLLLGCSATDVPRWSHLGFRELGAMMAKDLHTGMGG